MELLPDEDWPPSIGRHESNLAMIEHPRDPLPRQVEAEELLKDYVGGNVDKIVEQKREIKYEEVFDFMKSQDNSKHKFKMLIDGAPGVGKTVLCRRFCKDWAAGEILQEFSLVWLLHLRDLTISKAKSIEELLQHYDQDILKEVVQHIRKTGGAGNLLIFDGFDELSKQERTQCSLFLDIIRGKVLPNCSVVVSSRPYASQKLQEIKSITHHVEVVGFTKAQIRECIYRNIIKIEKAEKLIQALEQRLDILSLCYIPLNCAIMLYIYKQEDCQLPTTLTELYSLYTIHTIKRSITIHFENLDPDDITDLGQLKDPIYCLLRSLSKMAFQGLKNEQLGFTIDQLPPECTGGRGTKPELLGFMSASKFFSRSGRALTYQFTHLTVQEFLAAWHAATQLSVKEQNELIQEKWNDTRFRMMLLFLSGLTGLKDEQIYKDTLSKINIPQHKRSIASEVVPECVGGEDLKRQNCILFLAHQIYESQNANLSPILAKSLQEMLLGIDDVFLCTVLAYFLSTCHFKWRFLDLRRITPQTMKIMKNVSIEHSGSSISLTDNLCDIPFLENTHDLKLAYECDIPQALLCTLNLKQLTSLTIVRKAAHLFDEDLQRSKIWSMFLCDLFKALVHNTTLKKLSLHLTYVGVGRKEMEELRDMLRENTSLQKFRLSRISNVRNDNLIAECIASGLVDNHSLKTLTLPSISACVGVASIFRALERNTTLDTLEMPGCINLPMQSPSEIPILCLLETALYSMLVNNSTLTKLDLSMCENTLISNALFNGLKENSSLKMLNISSNNIGRQASETFADMLSCNSSLTELKLPGCNFKDKDVERGLLSNNTVKRVAILKPDRQHLIATLKENYQHHPTKVKRRISLLTEAKPGAGVFL